ncbi:MAG: DUF87 domain-containing protein, partial [Bacteroidales bacterium]|nr:DUF87 domain-containing protein [Bacteroidales bacterium]
MSFLIASRVDPNSSEIDFKSEDSSFILLRVMDAAALPQDKEAERIRVETAQRISGETGKHWDDAGSMDLRTKNLLGFAGVQCRIIGTFFLEENAQNGEAPLNLKFGSDISNYYPNRGLKVYKPNGKALEEIVNYADPSNKQVHFERYGNTERVKLGNIRYASTNRKYQQIDDVPVFIYPADLLSQKSALFGMTRTGKSNTTKIIAKSVFELRQQNDSNTPLRIGQIIFDPNGEYANENTQDSDGSGNPNALKNVWKLLPNGIKANEVVTYGITPHPNDPDRIRMLLNFYLDENLPIGKEIINSLLSGDNSEYIKHFLQVNLEKPDESETESTKTRYKRRVLAYRSVLARSGFPVPKRFVVSTNNLFNKDLLSAMENSKSDNSIDYQSASKVFSTDNPALQQLAGAFESLDKFIRENKEYKTFESNYVQKSKSGNTWADDDLKKVIGVFQYPNGTRKIGKAKEQHNADTANDYAEDIYNKLAGGKLVIIDQSTGDSDLNKSSADRIMNKIFNGNKARFIKGDTKIPEILVYVEEAHNILPNGTDLDTKDVWVRTAKEGAKYRIGMVYATQEVSSIQKNILKNTANWFISHLNNTDETK